MITTYKCKKLVWVDVENPTSEEIKTLMKKYAIHPLVANELLKPTMRPRTDVYKNFLYLILHFPIFDIERKGSQSCEIDFIVGKGFLITVHYKSIPPLYEITKVFEVNKILKDENMSKNSGVLACFIMRQLYNFALRQIDHIQQKMEKIEITLFQGKEYEMVEAISYVRRDILDFQKAVYMHDTALSSFNEAGKKFFTVDFSHYVHNIMGELTRVKSMLSGFQEMISSLQDTNDSLLSNKANETMKILSILAFLTFPLMLFAALFGMNTMHTPLIGYRGDFWIIVGIMAASTSGVIYIFKKKRWL